MKHPAKFSEELLPHLYNLIKDSPNVLDPFAGTCKIAELKKLGYQGKIYCNELEEEWAIQGVNKVDCITIGDAESLPFDDNYFYSICTSPTYGNRMADHHNAKDNSHRNTYTHTLGRNLNYGNTGKMQWGKDYCEKHERIWQECKRVLKNNSRLVLNISDHIRKGQIIPVTDWHITTLQSIGFSLEQHIKVNTKRFKFGTNSNLRVEYESICLFKLNKQNTILF